MERPVGAWVLLYLETQGVALGWLAFGPLALMAQRLFSGY